VIKIKIDIPDELRDQIIKEIIESVEFSDVENNLDDFELDVEFKINIDISDISLHPK